MFLLLLNTRILSAFTCLAIWLMTSSEFPFGMLVVGVVCCMLAPWLYTVTDSNLLSVVSMVCATAKAEVRNKLDTSKTCFKEVILAIIVFYLLQINKRSATKVKMVSLRRI